MLTVYDQISCLADSHEVEVVSWLNSEDEIAKRKGSFSPVPFRTDVRWVFLDTSGGRSGRVGKLRRVLGLLSGQASAETYHYPVWIGKEAQDRKPVDLEIFHHTVAYPWLRLDSSSNGARRSRACMVHDVPSELYEHRAIGANSAMLRWFYRYNAANLRRHEEKLPSLVDELWFVTPVEANRFERFSDQIRIRLTSPTFDFETSDLRRREFRESPQKAPKAVFGILGDMRHTPNLKSVLFLLEEVCPQLQLLNFGGEIWIAGGGISAAAEKLAGKFSFVRVLGFVKDLSEFWLKLSFMLVPHVLGTGVRMKLLEALAFGVPVIANEEAVRRIHPDLRTSPLVVVCDEARGWAEFMVKQVALSQRSKMAEEPFPKALDGHWVYRFLSDSQRDVF